MEGDTADGASSGGPQPASPSVVAAAPAAETTPSEGEMHMWRKSGSTWRTGAALTGHAHCEHGPPHDRYRPRVCRTQATSCLTFAEIASPCHGASCRCVQASHQALVGLSGLLQYLLLRVVSSGIVGTSTGAACHHDTD